MQASRSALIFALTLVMAHAGAQTPAAAPAATPWVKLGETSLLTLYMDQSTRSQVSEDVFRSWEIQDLKAPDPDGVRSRRYVNEYDCKHQMHRIGNVTSYSGPMLTGKKLFDVDDFGYWRKVPPKSPFALGFVIHCAK